MQVFVLILLLCCLLLIHTGRHSDGLVMAMRLDRGGPKASAEQEESVSGHRGQARQGGSQGGLLRNTGDLCPCVFGASIESYLTRRWPSQDRYDCHCDQDNPGGTSWSVEGRLGQDKSRGCGASGPVQSMLAVFSHLSQCNEAIKVIITNRWAPNSASALKQGSHKGKA
ncbi:hypothetical protein F5883DRAFT_585111, partial [Diaporthe sp. PMI_573]